MVRLIPMRPWHDWRELLYLVYHTTSPGNKNTHRGAARTSTVSTAFPGLGADLVYLEAAEKLRSLTPLAFFVKPDGDRAAQQPGKQGE
jgi:hypothetical protein